MRLSTFISQNSDVIVSKWEAFASTLLPAAADMDSLQLRDHADDILRAIAVDLETYQSREAQISKSLGEKPQLVGAPETAAQTHAILRAQSGFDINQLAAEYRALRASVLRLWMDAHPKADEQIDQLMRFNEAIDEALAESIGYFDEQVERARSLLLGVLGHDLRSPLQSIQMTATYLVELSAGREITEAAARLICSGVRMQALLDDLRDYNRIRFGMGIPIRRKPVDAAAVLHDEVSLLRAAYPERQIDFEIKGDPHGVWDAMRLRQVLSNLVENAIKYGDGTTAIRVAVNGEDADLLCSVENRGKRIEPRALETLFDPLRRNLVAATETCTPDSLGLGLYIVREIVTGHDGRISVQSNDQGTIFTVRLPRQPHAPAPSPWSSGDTRRVSAPAPSDRSSGGEIYTG